MRKNPRLPMLTSLRRKTWKPVLFQGCPKWQRSVGKVKIIGDLNLRNFGELDYLFAIFASNGGTVFEIECSGSKLTRWMDSVKRRGKGAAGRYEKQMRAHFEKYKRRFVAGYSIPSPPTPELRVIYDSAARSENNPTALEGGFSGQEYHWRSWPLSNVMISRGDA